MQLTLADDQHSNINLDLTQDRHSGYFTQALTEAYEKSKTFSGP